MNRIGVLKDVAYGLKSGGGTVADLGEAGELAPGAWALFNPAGTLLPSALTGADGILSDHKHVVLAFGRADGSLIVNVPRILKDLNRKNAVAAVNPIVTVGGITAADSVSFENEGEITVKVYDTTFSSRFGIPSVRASVYKTPNMTAEEAVDAVVAKLNAATSPFSVTAAKVKDGTDTYFGITITPDDYRQIEVATDGMWANDKIEQTTNATYGFGTYEQVLQMEKDFSVEEGNGNYTEFGQDFWKGSYEAVSGTDYDLITLLYDAYHSGPVTKRHVSSNRLVIAPVNGGSTTDADAVMTILAAVFPTAFSETEGVETAEDAG